MKRKTRFVVIVLILAVAVPASLLVTDLIRRDLLVDAAWDGDGRKVQAILRSHPHLAGAKGTSGYAPLHSAADHGHAPILEMLLEAGADPNVRDRQRRTPLHIAVRSGDALSVGRLLSAGADPAARDKQGRLPLHYLGLMETFAVPEHGKVIALLKEAGPANALELPDPTGETALHMVARLGNRPLADALILAGANINARSHSGQTPLHIALSLGSKRLGGLLVQQGADLTFADRDGITPLHLAASIGELEIMDAALQAGVPIEARDAAGATPLLYAARNRQYESFNELLFRGADRNARNYQGDTVLHVAVNEVPAHGLTYCWLFVNTAVTAGVDINAANDAKETPLIVAARAGHFDYTQSLLDNGADARAADRNGATALHLLAARPIRDEKEPNTERLMEATGMLLRNKADINARDRFGRTPLHLAADAGNREMARFLIKQGADPKVRDSEGRTPFQTAGWRLKMSSLITAYGLLALVFAEFAWVIVYERKRRRVKPKLSMWLALFGLALLLAFILWRAKPAMILEYGVVVAPAVSIVLLTELIGQNIRKTSERKARLFRRALIASGIAMWIGACAFYLTGFKTEPPLWLILGFGNGLIIGGGTAGKEPRDSGGWKPPAWREPSEQGKGPEESSGEVR